MKVASAHGHQLHGAASNWEMRCPVFRRKQLGSLHGALPELGMSKEMGCMLHDLRSLRAADGWKVSWGNEVMGPHGWS